MTKVAQKPPEPAAIADAVVEKPEDVVAAPEPLTLEAIDAQLAELDRRRVELRDALDKIPWRESELISNDGDDTAFDQLDSESKQLKRQLARLDLQERSLLTQATELRSKAWHDGWQELIARYSQVVEQFLISASKTFRLHAAVNDVVNEASARGYVGGPGLPLLLAPLPLLSDSNTNEYAKEARMIIARPAPVLPRRVELINVRFLKHWDMYFKNDEAGFLPDRAEWLIANGLAERVVTTTRRPLAQGR